VFKTCLYVAAHRRRTASRRREIVDNDRINAEVDDRATPEESAEGAEALAELDAEVPDKHFGRSVAT
jgi:hypothetical protein